MCAALFGLIAVCSTMVFRRRGRRATAGGPLRASGAATTRPLEEEIQVAVGCGLDARDALDGAEAAAISCAMARGAFRSRRASSNATGTARSPSARRGGASSAISAMTGSSAEMAYRAADGGGHPRANESMDRQNHRRWSVLWQLIIP